MTRSSVRIRLEAIFLNNEQHDYAMVFFGQCFEFVEGKNKCFFFSFEIPLCMPFCFIILFVATINCLSVYLSIICLSI